MVQEGLGALSLCLLKQKPSWRLPQKDMHSCYMFFPHQMLSHVPVPRIQGCVWKEKCRHLAQALIIRLHHWSCGRSATSIWTFNNLLQKKLAAFCEYLDENLEKGFIQHSKFPTSAPILFVKKKIILCKYVLIIMDLINSPSTISYFCLWYQGCWISLIMPRSTPRLIYVEHITWCAFKKVMNGRWCLKHIIVILNILWCHLALIMRLMFSNIWWTMFFVSTWMISWVAISMISSFSQRTWRTMNAMYI